MKKLIFVLDCLIIVLSGSIGLWYCAGWNYLMSHPWQYTVLWTCALPLFVVGMRVLKTCENDSFLNEVLRMTIALVIGFAMLNLLAIVLPDRLLAVHLPIALQIPTFVCAWIGQLMVRVILNSISS